jgi:hypothetical protein
MDARHRGRVLGISILNLIKWCCREKMTREGEKRKKEKKRRMRTFDHVQETRVCLSFVNASRSGATTQCWREEQ